MGWIDTLKQWLNIKEPEETEEERQRAEELRKEFKERYHHFKVLLAANQKSLEGMSEIEHALIDQHPFSMTFIRSKCTDIAVNVLKMVKNLERLAPQQYEKLTPVFFQNRKCVDDILIEKRNILPRDIVIPLQVSKSECIKLEPDLVGNKMASLGDISRCCNINIPLGFVITSYAYDLFVHAGGEGGLQTEIDRLIQSCDSDDIEAMHALSAKIRQMIIKEPIPDKVVQEIEKAWNILEIEAHDKNHTPLEKNRSLDNDTPLDNDRPLEEEQNYKHNALRTALRSSAIGEDSQNSSFAGQYHSELNVSRDSIFEAYKTVIASKYTLHAMMYRINKGFRDEDVPMAVGCVQMIEAVSGGVMYSGNPVDIKDDSIFISAVFGLPKAVVDGSVPSDLFVVSRAGSGVDLGTDLTNNLEADLENSLHIIKKEIAFKDRKFVCYPEEGICRMEITDNQNEVPAISDKQVIELANIALKLEAHFKTPQDIEWAVDSNGTIIILQSRPLQQNKGADLPKIETKNDVVNNILTENLIAQGGISASQGIASGEAFVALKHVDILRFPSGGVLVIRQALPEWAAVAARASAILSEQGSAASHLASVAREFKVPAVFGLEGITSKIKSGDRISVIADSQMVLNCREQECCKEQEHCREQESCKEQRYCSREQRSLFPAFKGIEKINPMKGSPVYNILERCSRHIIPLNLLDPDSPEFKPENCKTFHDITRFVHEKSVSEMFSFGVNHNFPEKSSKQLYYRVPMQWYILDLDDGFLVPIKGKYVKLEEIASIPMAAFWDGFVAIPWDGPPALDGKGMMSVMFHSTANTALTTGIKSAYSQHNYFMISKNYCSLNSRLGYHFSVMEALVGERISENYISFQFKGGAADIQRRLNRVKFIGNILEDYGFRSIINKDHLTSRIQGYDQSFMKSRLKILGHLTLHTRQLDMIMTNPVQVAFYDNKLRKEIDSLI